MLTILTRLVGLKRVTVLEGQRALYFKNGKLAEILTPGLHYIMADKKRSALEWHNIEESGFSSIHEKALFERLPMQAGRELTTFRTGPTEVAILERDGKVAFLLGPDQKKTVWTGAGPWHAEHIDVSGMPRIGPSTLRRLTRAKLTTNQLLSTVEVPEGHCGVMFVDGEMLPKLAPGVHAFWTVGRSSQARIIDLRWRPLEVSGQEILTADKVSIRVNITAVYRVTDPVQAVTTVTDYTDALYRALGQAFRRMLGAHSLDALLERQTALDDEALAGVRETMAAIGLEVRDVALKDIILPGEMRDILNGVVAAEKEAQANVIRRREETNATRSLLNTAKVMEQNPTMLRLKELEALETIATRVDRLTIHNGADGLMKDLVHLSGD
jgi:regulator of protease activity HflC (stomatin/prohibitin superfamily)